MHARRALVRRALAPARPRAGLGRLLTVLWAACLVAGIVMLGDFAYGMWRGVSDQQHINHVWTYQVGPTKAPPKAIDPSLKRPVDGVDLAIRYGRYRYRLVSTEIVKPNSRTALVTDVNGYHLTLTTCWPLWAGAFATQRYIIHADQVWPVPIRPGYT